MPKALGSKHRKGQTMLRVWLILPLLCLLQACSSAFLNRPVIEDKVGNSSQKGIGTLAITAERKVVLVNFKNNRFCAEPPQDFGQAITAMAEIVAAYKREKPEAALGTTHDANLSFKNSMETTLKEVAKQPYGIMFLRYQSSFLCQMFANAALSDDEYRDFADKTMDRAYEILGKEVEFEILRAKMKRSKEQVRKRIWDAFKSNTELVFQLPKHAKQAYKDFSKTRKMSVQVNIEGMDKGFEVSTKEVSQNDDEWVIKLLKLDKDSDAIYKEKHAKKDITLTFKASQIKSLDVPEVIGVITITQEEKHE